MVNIRQELLQEIKGIIKNEIDLLEKESQIIQVKIKIYFKKYLVFFFLIQ